MVFQGYAVIVVFLALWFAAVHVLCRKAVAGRFKLSFGSVDYEKRAWNFLPSQRDYVRVFYIWLAAFLISGAVYFAFAKPIPINIGVYMLLPLVIVMAAELFDPIMTRSFPASMAEFSRWPAITVGCFVVEAMLINLVLYILVSFAVVSQWIPFVLMLTVSGMLAVAVYSFIVEQLWVMKMIERNRETCPA